jgi:PAS domain-containing protein
MMASETHHGQFAANWEWDLATGRMTWGGGLDPLFGYRDRVTDAGWREERIHPEDRKRVKLSLERATIVNQGSPWSERYRFRHADGSYVTVAERAYVIQDAAGPCRVRGALSLEAVPLPSRRG